MVRVYVAAPSVWRPRAQRLRDDLVVVGLDVVSTWFDRPPAVGVGAQKEQAAIDLKELAECEVLVLLCGYMGLSAYTGGRHFEAGFATASGKVILVVGEPDNLFYQLPAVVRVGWLSEVPGKLRDIQRSLIWSMS